VNFNLELGECWCVNECTHNDYFSFTDYGQQFGGPSVTCMLDKIPYATLSKKWPEEIMGGDKKVKFLPNALQGNCAKNEWVLGTSVAKDGGFQGYIELGRLNGGQEPVFVKTPTECIAMAAADDRCHPTATAINFHFADESKYGFENTGKLVGPVGTSLGNQNGQCFCTGKAGPPTFTRKNWVHILSCLTAAPDMPDSGEEAVGPKPGKETCQASKAKYKPARKAKKEFSKQIRDLKAQLKALKAQRKAQQDIINSERATVKACRR